MTVHCEGACRVIEQLGEKQEFEIALSRLGFRHEHFELHVMRNATQPAEENDYSVTVVSASRSITAARAGSGCRNAPATSRLASSAGQCCARRDHSQHPAGVVPT